MKKKLTTFILLIILFSITYAQDINPIVKLKFDTRFDFETKLLHSDKKSQSSFDGKFLNIILEGNINDKFSYNYRQRLILDGINNYRSFFNATDWIYLTYNINKNIYISGGKQVIAIGGFEYDAAPIDQYFWSNFWNSVICYQFGTTINFKSNNQNHNVGFQITNSPFAVNSMANIFSYNLIWYGKMNWFNTIYSINFVEYEKGNFINYIALGNKFNFGKISFEFDLMNRVSTRQKDFFSDYSIIGDLKYNINNKIVAFVKAGYDQNKAQDTLASFIYDRFVIPGVEYLFYGLGAEYFPLNNRKDIRLHAFWATNNDKNKYHSFNVGIRWQMKVFEK